MEKYEYLAEHVLEIMQLSDSERIETLFTDRWIGYKKAHSIVNLSLI
ncbi:TniB family NTP-binding protein, partial [Acinetobacter baumannii]